MDRLADDLATSDDLVAKNLEQLRETFPQVFVDGKVDFEALRQLLGDEVDEGDEKFGLNWHGKKAARRLALTPTTGTLRPAPEDSVDWDTTQNLVIEGDNLEVLKLLQKSYSGEIKLIYIDPPYNTGNDFVYPDDYTDNLGNYLELTGQKDNEGNGVTSNPETSGRFHTSWLKMIYPRLILARQLLRDDGVLLCSIDYHEGHHLRTTMNEVFGETNFVGEIAWESKTKSQNTATSFDKLQPKVETILVYTKGGMRRFNLVPVGEREYPETDGKGSFRFAEVEQMAREGVRGRQTMVFPILGVEPRHGNQWKLGSETIAEFEARGDLSLDSVGRPTLRVRPDDERNEVTAPFWGFFPKTFGTAETAKRDLKGLLGDHGFDTVKPVELLQRLVFHVTSPGDLVLDFFAGSGTTGHAVMEQNAADGRNRRYILVQLPEPLDPSDKDQRTAADFCDSIGKPRSIAELTKERLRRAAAKIQAEHPDHQGDLGFRVYKLDTSNLHAWDPQPEDLEQQLHTHSQHVKEDRTRDDLHTELLLKHGLDLTSPTTSCTVGAHTIYETSNATLITILTDKIAPDDLDPLAEHIIELLNTHQPEDPTLIIPDHALTDTTKANLTHTLQQAHQHLTIKTI